MVDVSLLQYVAVLPFGLLLYGWVSAFLEPGVRPYAALDIARQVSFIILLCAAAMWFVLIGYGPWTLDLVQAGLFHLVIRVDILSTTLFSLVSLIAAVCLTYSRNYLDGDARQGDFTASMLLTQGAVSALILAGSLTLFWLAWVAVSLALHRLLVFYSDRPQARRAALKKFMVARVSDIALLAAFICLGLAAGTGDISQIALWASAGDAAASWQVTAAALLIALAAVLKSAQIPTHGWLTEVMETPTPVSALLHAGIVNAGGFLVLRFADVMLTAPSALLMLAIVGGMTALVASAVMMFQPAIKVSLAWSTIAQMGFMILQCGLGAFAAATLHIVAHSFYKAYAFLSSGSVIDIHRTMAYAGAVPSGRRPLTLVWLMATVSLFGFGAIWLADQLTVAPASLLLGLVLMLGLANLVLREMDHRSSTALGVTLLAAALGLAAIYVVLQKVASLILAPVLPVTPAVGAMQIAIMALAAAGFTALAVLQHLGGRHSQSGKTAALRVHLANGLYLSAWLDRLAYRIVPAAAQKTTQTRPTAFSGASFSGQAKGDLL